MSDEAGTKPAEGDGTKPSGVETGTSDTGTGTTTAEPSQPQAQPSEDWQRKYQDSVRGMNEAQREAAEARAEAERLRQMAEVAIGRVQQQEDPVSAAHKAWQENYYTAEAPGLLQRYLDLRDARREQEFSARTMQQFQLQQRIPVAAQMLGINDQGALAARLKSVHSTLTPDELALVELNRSGKLDSYVAQSKTQREAEARRATALDQFGAIRGAPRIPGDNPDGDAKLIPFEEWAAASPDAKQRLRSAKEKFVIVGAPKHFDPTRD